MGLRLGAQRNFTTVLYAYFTSPKVSPLCHFRKLFYEIYPLLSTI